MVDNDIIDWVNLAMNNDSLDNILINLETNFNNKVKDIQYARVEMNSNDKLLKLIKELINQLDLIKSNLTAFESIANETNNLNNLNSLKLNLIEIQNDLIKNFIKI